MSLIEHVLNHEVFKEIADQIDEEGRKEVEEQVKEMLENVDTLYLYVKDILNTEDGIDNLSEALHHALLSKEGQEEWLEKP
jgi:selenocysteine-specific translation elongation factor|tara:strand:- start:272 stop:514 length:243 start_codon:yes stop_codon:yes gene_type:complete